MAPDSARPVCPRDRSRLEPDLDRLHCPICDASYPVIVGIPSFLFDALNSEDRDLLKQLIEMYPSAEFEDMVLALIGTKRISESQRRRFVDYVLEASARGDRFQQMFRRRLQEAGWVVPSRRIAIDVGCGLGAGLKPLSQAYDHVVGVDVKITSLIIAKKLVESAGLNNVTLVHASAFALPFADGVFDYATAVNVLEHVFHPDQVLREISRALSDGGVLSGDSRNRFDLFFREPHVQLRWVGFLPRRWMAPYVRRRIGHEYDHTHLLSYRELNRALSSAFGRDWRIVMPLAEAYGFSARLGRWVESLSGSPLAGILAWFAPTHIVIARKTAAQTSTAAA